jgi:hypothetical protein
MPFFSVIFLMSFDALSLIWSMAVFDVGPKESYFTAAWKTDATGVSERARNLSI